MARTYPGDLSIPRLLQACPRHVPEPPSTANRRHQQQPVNLKLARASNREQHTPELIRK
jgi:hypothetical protein